ncbi:MAG: hypothetical protein COA84_05000 [Robiginitomaculum sp.]|nr:MAG: hypothetical protein COA84_05000 [Robiginitomaculum sp.]
MTDFVEEAVSEANVKLETCARHFSRLNGCAYRLHSTTKIIKEKMLGVVQKKLKFGAVEIG